MNPNVTGAHGASAAAFQGFGRAEEATAAAKTGEWNGLAVSSEADPASLIADAAEEMSFGASEEVEKDVADRKKVDKKDQRDPLKVNPPDEVMEKMKQNLQSRMGKLKEALAAAGGNPAKFREALEELFPDSTERHAALLMLGEELESQPSLRALVEREIETLETEQASEIQAGYNISDVDAGGLGEGVDANGLYRKTVLGGGDISGVLEKVLAESGDGDFARTIDFLRRSVGADLSAATPSMDKADLETMNSDLFNLRALGNFTREFDQAVGSLRERHRLPALPNVGRDILGALLKNKDARIVMLDPVKTALGMQREANPTYDVQALTRTHMLAHKMPTRLFADAESRQRLLDGLQKFIDSAVDLEESLLAEE